MENNEENLSYDLDSFAKDVLSKLDDFDSRILSVEEKTEITGFDETLTKLKQVQDSIDKYADLPEKYQDSLDLLEVIQEYKDDISEYKDQVESLLNHSIDKKSSIDDLHKKILGYSVKSTNSGKEEKVAGLKDDLEQAYSEIEEGIDSLNSTLDDYIKINDKKLKDVLDTAKSDIEIKTKKINELLPGAMAAGLSEAYREKADQELAEKDRFQNSFTKSILALTAVSVIPVLVILYLLFVEKINIIEVINYSPQIVLTMLPIYIPILWLAYSFNKKINLSKRLIEEYTHKLVLGKTFTGLSGQIDSLSSKKDTINELKTQLLYNLLKASSENPGKLISNYNKSDHPILETLENSAKLGENLEFLSKVPGMSALIKKLSTSQVKKANKQANLAEDGLSTK